MSVEGMLIHLQAAEGGQALESFSADTQGACWVRLLIDAKAWPAGWGELRLRLRCAGVRGATRLRMVLADGSELCCDLPVSRKGTLHELIEIPAGLQALWLLPMSLPGRFECRDASFQVRGRAGVQWARWRRAWAMWWRQPAEVRRRMGLTAWRCLTDPAGAYKVAGALRDWASQQGYTSWVLRHAVVTAEDVRCIRRVQARWRKPPHFCLMLQAAPGEEAALAASLASLAGQLYGGFSVILPEGLAGAPGHWPFPVLPAAGGLPASPGGVWRLQVPAGTRFAPHALYWFAHEIRQHPDAALVYCDHDLWLADGLRAEPCFKPDWSPELLRATNYPGAVVAWRAQPGAALPVVDLHDQWLRLSESLAPHQVRHIAAPLLHFADEAAAGMAASPAAVSAHLARLGIAAQVDALASGHCRVRYALPASPPRVSIVIPTRNGLEHLQPCVESVLRLTRYPAVEILVVDNQSDDPATLAYFAELEARGVAQVMRYDQPFNYSAINNAAVARCSGEVVCLLNNDTEVIAPDWLEWMVGHLLQAQVGVVGAKLLYGDGRVQHAGDAVGPGGCADHLHAGLGGDEPGYMHRAVLAQDLSAVTGACLLTWRALFQRLGGLDAKNLPVAFNDVDYCLRVREAGLRVVWTPQALLYHHESVSRGKDLSPERKARAEAELRYMRKRWRTVMQHDPFYNPNLSYDRPDFSLGRTPRVMLPWLGRFL
jgi:O-antigen biosynthesis protein